MSEPASPGVSAAILPQSRSGRIDSLDGLRALSVVVVVLGHAKNRSPSLKPILEVVPTLMGVNVFFVVSGYIITRLLLAEEAKRGSVSLAEFYIRRFFRIVPALYVYVGTIIALAVAGMATISPSGFVGALTFTWNYPFGSRDALWLDHCWSLGVEEQFYIFWPCLLVAIGPRRALRVAVVIVLLEPVVRVLQYLFLPGTRWYASFMGHAHMDTILFGCILSLAETHDAGGRWLKAHIHGLHAAVAASLLVFSRAMDLRFHGAWYLGFGLSLEGLCIATILFWSISDTSSRVARLLSLRPVVWVGRISYSLYLWQQLFIPLTPGTVWGPVLNIPLPLSVAVAVGCAVSSYYLIERPMLRVRDRVISARRASHPMAAT